ncbi:hypothetical protein [Helicobacter ganmani]|uniref:hypothetical protein n=1 Tax=Helicobacter ganmani TaxID=60246 RepID=UPI003A841A80
MTTLALDSKNNLIVFGNFVTRSGIDAVAQDIKNLLLMWQKEYPFNLTKGINYYELVSQNSNSLVKKEITRRILEDKRILNIAEINVSFERQQLKISATLETTEGVIRI